MKHDYIIEGMSCDGCRSKVEKALNTVEGITAEVSLDPPKASIAMEKHIPTEKLQAAVTAAGNYKIEMAGNHQSYSCRHHAPATGNQSSACHSGKYYCPMHCEGEKLYDQPGNCPVCGMNLEKVPALAVVKHQYTCPMHPEIIKDAPGSCPICGMDLIPMQPTAEEEDTTYKSLVKKMKVAVIFTVPVFLIAMLEMVEGINFTALMPQIAWNWLQFILTLPVVFYATWMFFERAWVSIRTMNLNMFTLIGIGAGAAFIFSIISLLFPSIFPEQFRSHNGTVFVYFEAVSVILTLVLLGQLLEARAHSRTSGAIKELLKLAPTEATLVIDGQDKVIPIDEIKKGDLLRVKPGEKIPVDGKVAARQQQRG